MLKKIFKKIHVWRCQFFINSLKFKFDHMSFKLKTKSNCVEEVMHKNSFVQVIM